MLASRNLSIATAAFVLLIAIESQGQIRDPRFDIVRGKVQRILSEQKIPAISVGVAEKGEVRWEEGFGFANKEKRIRATGRSIYNIGSTSKPITATAIMMLVERGKLKLDAPANDFLTKPAQIRSTYGDLANVTIRRLLDHTSGLSRHSQTFVGAEKLTRPDIEETFRRYAMLTKPAGEVFEYSNLGYGILGHIVTRGSRKPFGRFLRDEVFLPLGMRDSYLNSSPKSSSVTAYGPDQMSVGTVLSDTPGASDVFSSVHDLLRFGMFHLGVRPPGQRPILKHDSLDEMKRGSSVRGMAKYGLGWESMDVGKYRLVYHHGSNGYGTSIFVLVPSHRICISILSNVTTPTVQALVDDILGILITGYSNELAAFRSNAPASASATSYKPTGEYVGHWRGSIQTWKEEIPVEMWFQPDGDIQIQLRGQYRQLLNGVRFDEGYLRGSFQSNIGTADADRHRYNLHLKLKLRDSGIRLDGAITSSSIDPQGNVLTSSILMTRVR